MFVLEAATGLGAAGKFSAPGTEGMGVRNIGPSEAELFGGDLGTCGCTILGVRVFLGLEFQEYLNLGVGFL